MSQPSDPTWGAPDSASGAPPPEPGVTPEPGGRGDAASGSEESGEPASTGEGSGWFPPPAGGTGPGGGGYGGPPGGYGPADGGYGGPVGSGAALFVGPAPVLVSFAPPAPQNRLTIAVRLLLALPHLIILYALQIAAEVVAFIGWFGALFTGSLPLWAHTFITGVLRWQARVYAYTFFLTGHYPPFSFEDEPYPVRLVTARARLNRFAVFFRLILVIPAALVCSAAIYGIGVLSFVFWIIALVLGRLPDSLHQALAAIVRFQARFYGYFGLVTGVYPWWGLFGDPVPAPVAAPGSAADGDVTPAAVADPWKLPLSAAAAQGLVALIIVFGVAAGIVVGIVQATRTGNAVSNAQSLVTVRASYERLTTSSQDFASTVQACGQLSCVTAADRQEATALKAFATAVSSAGVGGSAAADANTLISDANAAAQSLDQLASATSVAQYQSDASGSQLQQQLNSLDADYAKLTNDLRV